ncbi:MAG: type VI secretion system baseplate subunit TssG [Desulfovibrionaceae bacterium]
MAPHGWRSDHSVADWLQDEGHRFGFYQAVRLLEMLRPWLRSPGEETQPDKEAVRFTSRVSFDFPASEVFEVRPPAPETGDKGPANMEVTFMGLTGALGPMPGALTELILDRAKRRDFVLKDFLDIFNHRLVSLMYRVRKTRRLGFEWKHPSHSLFATYAYSLMGMGTEGLRGKPGAAVGRLAVHDGALLRYTALLANQPRSMVGLENMLSDYFGVTVRGTQFTGGWYILEPDQYTRIGMRKGANNVLGESALLGGRVWEQRARFRLDVGPLDFDTYVNFLPVGEAFEPLCQLVRFYTEAELDADIRFKVKAPEARQARLGASDGSYLGWTAWLGAAPHEKDAAVGVTLRTWTEEPFRVDHELYA